MFLKGVKPLVLNVVDRGVVMEPNQGKLASSQIDFGYTEQFCIPGVTSEPLSVSSHPKYRQHHTHSLYDITLAICVASFALYKTSHPHFMT